MGGVTGAGAFSLFLTAALAALLSGLLSTQVFKWIRNSSVSSEVMDNELEGKVAQVALEVSDTHRGKIIVDVAGAREQMTASPIDGSTVGAGEKVVIVKTRTWGRSRRAPRSRP